jgi:hypothetical protein
MFTVPLILFFGFRDEMRNASLMFVPLFLSCCATFAQTYAPANRPHQSAAQPEASDLVVHEGGVFEGGIDAGKTGHPEHAGADIEASASRGTIELFRKL